MHDGKYQCDTAASCTYNPATIICWLLNNRHTQKPIS